MFTRDTLNDRVALITGGGTGLGRAVTEQFVRHGAKCVIAGRREDVLRSAAAEIDPEGQRILVVPCDVRNLDEVERAVEEGYARFGKIDVLVNNAAGNFISPTELLTPNAFKLISDIVWMGAVHTSLTLGKRWIADKQPATILNVLTVYARTGSGYVVPSACAKAAVESMTTSLAAEWGKYGIRVLGVAPGPFPTEGAMSRLVPDDEMNEYITSRIPLGRLGTLEEFGLLATFLASPMARYISGEVVRIDGAEAPFLAGEFNFLDDMSSETWREYRRKVRGFVRPPRH